MAKLNDSNKKKKTANIKSEIKTETRHYIIFSSNHDIQTLK